ncbi:MAG: hypothetical protein WBY53_18785 [Acidobacteriaceae bacterium]
MSLPAGDERRRERRGGIALSKLATIFASAFGIAFGLCSVTVVVGGSYMDKIGNYVLWISAGIEGICGFGLLVIGFIAFIRRFDRKGA